MEEFNRQLAEQIVDQLKDSTVPCQILHESLMSLIAAAQDLIKFQPFNLSAPMKVVGNINGQFSHLLNIFNSCGWPPAQKYLFLGDYVDVGERQVDTMTLLLALKILHPESLSLLRGHHETYEVNSIGGFKAECIRLGYGLQIHRSFNKLFYYLPLSAVIGGRILCVHGGIPRGLESIDQLAQMSVPLQIQPGTMEADLLWSGPSEQLGWQFNETSGIGHTFGPDVVEKFCRDHNLDLIVRSHQICPNGYEIFAGGQLITVFSSPNFVAKNDVAVLSVAEDFTYGLYISRFVSAEEQTVRD